MTTTANQIESNANIIKAHLFGVLLDIKENNASVLTDENKGDLERLLSRCDRLIDLAQYIREQSQQLTCLTK